MINAQIWLIWLAVMWANLARNIANKWFKTLVYNRSYDKTKEFISEYWNENLEGVESLKDFVESIQRPRKIIIMVKAWEAVDDVINQLKPMLEKDDIIIDCWNSYYKDTIRRTNELYSYWIRFVGCWVSGWEEWALNGPSIMPWWDFDSWLQLKPVLESIAAKDFSGWSCVTYVWEDWAGHYVKMVHNGIEYWVMQIIAEAAWSLKNIYGLTPPQIWKIFEKFDQWRLNSYLFEIMINVLNKEDEFNDGEYLIDYILDKAWEKWTGKRTVMEAIERWIPLPSIAQAVFARSLSAQKDLRVSLSKIYESKTFNKQIEIEEFVKLLEDSLYAGMLSNYAQWYSLIQTAASQQWRNIDLWEISRIWEWWCIIRAKILNFLHESFQNAWNKNINLLAIPQISKDIQENLKSYEKIVSILSLAWIPAHSLAAWLTYLQDITSSNGSACYIQWLRDYFGAHTYQRTDKDWIFHTNW